MPSKIKPTANKPELFR